MKDSAASRSAGSLNRTQPSTPSPPALLIAAATCSDGVNPKIGCWMPSRSQSESDTDIGCPPSWFVLLGVRLRPAVVGFAARRSAHLVDEPDAAWRLVAGEP